MRVALLGGRGRVSRYFCEELLGAGHEVRLLSRSGAPRDDSVEVVRGDALRLDDVSRLLTGCSAVVNCVGRLRNAGDFYAPITGNVLSAMSEQRISRYVLVTSSAVHTSQDSPTFVARAGAWAFRLVFPHMVADKQSEYELVAGSSIDWTVFRLPLVFGSSKVREAKTDPASLNGAFVSTRAVALAVVRELNGRQAVRQAPYLFV